MPVPGIRARVAFVRERLSQKDNQVSQNGVEIKTSRKYTGCIQRQKAFMENVSCPLNGVEIQTDGQTNDRKPQLPLSDTDGTLKKASHGDGRTVN